MIKMPNRNIPPLGPLTIAQGILFGRCFPDSQHKGIISLLIMLAEYAQTRDTNIENGLGKTTNLHLIVILEATQQKAGIGKELDTEREGSTFEARRGQTNLCATGAARDGGGGQMKKPE